MLRFFICLAVATSVAGIALFFADWRNRAAFIGETGFIVAGERLGVKIGAQSGYATQILAEHGYREISLPAIRTDSYLHCGGHPTVPDGEIRWFRETQPNYFMGGPVCLVSVDGTVRVFGWHLGIKYF
jgi:hypothetical protein